MSLRRVFSTQKGGYYDAHLLDRLVTVSSWELMHHSLKDDGRETDCFDVSRVSLQLPHDNGSLLELVPEKNLRSPSC